MTLLIAGNLLKTTAQTDNTAPSVTSSSYTYPDLDCSVVEVNPDTVYWALVANPSTPSAAQVIAGTGGGILEAGSFPYANGFTSVVVNLTDETGDEIHLVFTDQADNNSGTPSGGNNTIVTGVVVDTTAPSLSNPTDSPDGTTAGSGTVDTSEGTGTLYWVVTTLGTQPTPEQIIGGQDHNGDPALDSGSQAVTEDGTQTLSPAPSGLEPSTTYRIHYMHRDAFGNNSAVSTANGFTTDAETSATFHGWGSNVKTAGSSPTTSMDCSSGAPSGIASGDMLVAICSVDDGPTITGSTGWTKLFQDDQFGAVTGGAFYRIADEGANDNFTLNSSASQEMSVYIARFSGVTNISASYGSNLSFNPPNHTPASNGKIWLAGVASDSADHVTSAPGSYTNFVSDGGGVGSSVQVSGAIRVLDAASENPSAFIGGGGEQNVCFTVAVW